MKTLITRQTDVNVTNRLSELMSIGSPVFTNADTLQQCINNLTFGSSMLASAERHEAHYKGHAGFDADAPTVWTDFTDDPDYYTYSGYDEAPTNKAFLA